MAIAIERALVVRRRCRHGDCITRNGEANRRMVDLGDQMLPGLWTEEALLTGPGDDDLITSPIPSFTSKSGFNV